MSVNLNFDDGRKEYTINGDENKKIRINLGDPAILMRLNDFMKRTEDKKKEYENQIKNEGMDDREYMTATTADMDAFLRKEIDILLDYPVSDVVFGNMSPMATVKGGKALYETFIDSLMPELKACAKKNAEAQKKRVDKYRKQYHT